MLKYLGFPNSHTGIVNTLWMLSLKSASKYKYENVYTNNSWLWFGFAFEVYFYFILVLLCSWRPLWIGLLTSSNISTATNSLISFCARNFLPDLSRGLTSRILLSAELLSIHCVLILQSLYSSTKDLTDSRSYWRVQPMIALEESLSIFWYIG